MFAGIKNRQTFPFIFNPMQKLLHSYKNAFSGLSPSTWWLSLVMLINRAGTMVMPFMTLYMTTRLHFNIIQAGFVMALFGLGAVCGGILGGKLTDLFGFYNIQLVTLLSGGVLFIALGQMKDYTSICCVAFLLAMLNDSFRPANATAIAHYSTGENRTRSYSLNRLSVNLGWACGGALGGFVASQNYQLLFWIDGLTNIAAALLLLAVLSPARNEHTPVRTYNKTKEKAASPYKDRVYLAFIVFTIMLAYSFFQLFSVQPIFYNRVFFLSPFTIGLLMAVNGALVALIEMPVVFRLEGKRNSLSYISIGVLLIGASFIVYNVLPAGTWLAVFSTFLFTAGEIMCAPFLNAFWTKRSDSSNRGQYAGLYSVAWSVAQVLGPSTGSVIAERYGFKALWWVVGGMCTTACIGFNWLRLFISAKTNRA